jgi:hypothetical protein
MRNLERGAPPEMGSAPLLAKRSNSIPLGHGPKGIPRAELPALTTCCTEKGRVGKGGCPLSEVSALWSTAFGKPKVREHPDRQGPAPLRVPFLHSRREKRPSKRALSSQAGDASIEQSTARQGNLKQITSCAVSERASTKPSTSPTRKQDESSRGLDAA